MKKRYLVLIMILLCTLLTTTTVYASGTDSMAEGVTSYGWLTLLPPLVAIVLAFITKNVLLSLFVGILTGAFLIQIGSNNIFGGIIQALLSIVGYVMSSLADPWNAGIILQLLAIGGMIALVSKMGGARAVAESLAKKAKGPRSTQIITWIQG